jgi:xanthine dehydrogenase YagS FAD-binding subunit
MAHGIVQRARVVLGQVAPVPWGSPEAAHALQGKPLTDETARQAGRAAVESALPLAHNEYKIQLAEVAVTRAILRAAHSNREDASHGLPAYV